jgi:hypothetical protein
MKKLIRDFFFYEAESFTWSQFLFDACIASAMLFVMVFAMWLVYAMFG